MVVHRHDANESIYFCKIIKSILLNKDAGV